MGPKAEAAYLKIQTWIRSGDLAVGERLPSERELVARLGVGRTMLRQVLARLVAENVIEVRDRTGYYVLNSSARDVRLAQVSEFRLVYWNSGHEKIRYLKVSRDWDDRSGRWAIFDGESGWDGVSFRDTWTHPESYRWELNEALALAESLALSLNQEMIGVMELRYPGEFRGTKTDLRSQA